MSAKNIAFVQGRDSVAFSVDGKPLIVPKTHVNYHNIIAALEKSDMDAVRPLLVSARQYIADSSDGLITVKDNVLYFGDEKLHNSLTTRIIALLRDGFDVKPLSNFLRNLMDNPSKTAIDELYLFLEDCELPITADGHFIAYKMIRRDYTDKYSGKMDNSVGATVKMNRRDVDDKRANTCSDGLHFASLHYITNGSYGNQSNGDRLVALKINPRDVVSIPSDYNNSKGRACEYLVLREMRWSERLPVHNTGFRFLNEDETDDGDVKLAGDVTQAALILTPTGAIQPRPGVRIYTDDDIRRAKHKLGLPDASLTALSKETGMSRRQLARIRDGEIGANL